MVKHRSLLTLCLCSMPGLQKQLEGLFFCFFQAERICNPLDQPVSGWTDEFVQESGEVVEGGMQFVHSIHLQCSLTNLMSVCLTAMWIEKGRKGTCWCNCLLLLQDVNRHRSHQVQDCLSLLPLLQLRKHLAADCAITDNVNAILKQLSDPHSDLGEVLHLLKNTSEVWQCLHRPRVELLRDTVPEVESDIGERKVGLRRRSRDGLDQESLSNFSKNLEVDILFA